MSLTFEYEKDIEAGLQPFISHEKDSSMYNYYISNELAMDKYAAPNEGIYEDTTFDNEDRHLTTKAVSRIGVKNFPGIGGIGFYRDAYSDECRIVAPIHPDKKVLKAPILKVIEIVDNKLHIVIEPPADIAYTCYRVVVRQKAFAFEYIMYKTDYYVDLPTVKGDYIAYCIGYDEDTSAISEDSNELSLTVENGSTDWSPANMDAYAFEARLSAVEDEIANYPDSEVSEGIKKILGGD